jgi:hypothetical protein
MKRSGRRKLDVDVSQRMSWYDVYGDFELVHCMKAKKAGKGRKPSKHMNCGENSRIKLRRHTYMLYKDG